GTKLLHTLRMAANPLRPGILSWHGFPPCANSMPASGTRCSRVSSAGRWMRSISSCWYSCSATSDDFHVHKTEVTLGILLTLAARPIGALLFGRLADRFGRRPVL